jgi:hypothetical protein
MTKKVFIVMFFITGIFLTAASIFAGSEKCCAKCGCQQDLQCVCRPIHTTKYIEITCWDSVCEDVCLPPRTQCKACCAACNDTTSQRANGEIAAADACQVVKIRSCNKLVRKTYLQPIPTVVWIVEYLCPHCRCADKSYSPMPCEETPAK